MSKTSRRDLHLMFENSTSEKMPYSKEAYEEFFFKDAVFFGPDGIIEKSKVPEDTIKMSKFKIVSYFLKTDGEIQRGISSSNNIDNSDKYLQCTELFNLLTKKYCDIHGYSFEFKYINDNDLAPIVENKKRYPCLVSLNEKQERFENIVLYKLLLTRDALLANDSEYVAFLDPDAFISNPNVSLDEFIDNEHEFWMSPGNAEFDRRNLLNDFFNLANKLFSDNDALVSVIKDWNNGFAEFKKTYEIDVDGLFKILAAQPLVFNEGFFIVKNTERMKNMFQAICENFWFSYNSFYFNGVRYTSEGFLINMFLRNKNYEDAYAHMSMFSQGHVMGAYDAKYDEDRSFIQHNYSVMPIEDRLKFAQKLKLNKWWKPILSSNEIKSILIESSDAYLGDLLTTTQFIKEISEQYPNMILYFDFPFIFRYSDKKFSERLEEVAALCKYVKIWHGEQVNKIIDFKNKD